MSSKQHHSLSYAEELNLTEHRTEKWQKMGMVVSSVVSAGPQVLEDFDTQYVGLQDGPTKENERRKSKSKTRKPNKKSQLENRKGKLLVISTNKSIN